MRQMLAIGAVGLSLVTSPALGQETVPAGTESDAPQTTVLRLGDPAPKLSAKTWLKGEPIKEFKEGEVYVVEFWATWCPPCLKSIPHLTKLQKQYKDDEKKVTIIGVSSETESEIVTNFVEERGPQMDYTVVLDDRRKTGKAWMLAAGQAGIPTAFIVDQQKRVAWIGHPMAGMDKVLEEIVEGTYDLDAMIEQTRQAEAEAARLRNTENAMRIALARVNEEWKKGNKVEALVLVEDVLDIDANGNLGLALTKFRMLLIDLEDVEGAYAYARELMEDRYSTNARGLRELAWEIVGVDGERDLELAMQAADRACVLTDHLDARALDAKARVHFEMGQVDEAVRVAEAALEVAKDDFSFEAKLALDRYKAARSGGG